MDLKDFKKVATTKTHTIMQHPDGHTIHLAHEKLDSRTKGELKRLPLQHFDNGGTVKPQPQPKPQPTPKPQEPPKDTATTISKGFNNALGFADGGEVPNQSTEPSFLDSLGVDTTSSLGDRFSRMLTPIPGRVQSELPNPDQGLPVDNTGIVSQPNASQAVSEQAPTGFAPSLPPSTSTQSNPDPYGMANQGQTYKAGLGQAIQGEKDKAAALGVQGDANAQVSEQNIKAVKTAQEHFAEDRSRLDSEHQMLVDAINNGHVNPSQYINNMSTGSKITTAIGLILGGLGSGGDPKNNPALTYLNDQIARDVEAQKFDMGNKKTLLEANLRQYGNMRDAADVTMAQLKTLTAAQMEHNAALSQKPLALAAAQQGIGGLKMQASDHLDQVAQRQAMAKSMQSGQASPAQAISLMVPEKHQAEATKEYGIAEKTNTAHKAIDSIFDQMAKQQTTANRAWNPMQSMQNIAGLRAQLVPLIMESSPSKRLTHESLQAEIDPLIPGYTSRKETAANLRAQMHQLVDTHADSTPTLEQYGIKPPRYKTTSPKTQLSFTKK